MSISAPSSFKLLKFSNGGGNDSTTIKILESVINRRLTAAAATAAAARDNGGGDSFGGGGGDECDDEEEREFGPILKFEEVMKEAEARGVKLPSDMMEAAKITGIRKLFLLRYLDLQIVVDSCCATFAEMKKRGKDFWSEFELYLTDLLVSVVVDIALVGMSSSHINSLCRMNFQTLIDG
ncbi:hypothetical protein CRYUN_Cryun11dG0114100 [Craigia yunnanensis]